MQYTVKAIMGVTFLQGEKYCMVSEVKKYRSPRRWTLAKTAYICLYSKGQVYRTKNFEVQVSNISLTNSHNISDAEKISIIKKARQTCRLEGLHIIQALTDAELEA